MMRICLTRPASRRLPLVLLALAVLPALAATACSARNSPREAKPQGELLFETGPIGEARTPLPARSDATLRRYQLIRVTPDIGSLDFRDIGYLREEELVVKLKEWDETTETGFNLRDSDAFKYVEENEDGSTTVWEAVTQPFLLFVDLTGQPVGTIDEFGTIHRYDAGTGALVEIGAGGRARAVELLYGVRERYYFDREDEDVVHLQPQVQFVTLDGETAQQRFNNQVADRESETFVIVEFDLPADLTPRNLGSEGFARIELASNEEAATFEPGDLLVFYNVENPEFADALAAVGDVRVTAVEENVLVTDLYGRYMPGRFQAGIVGKRDLLQDRPRTDDPDARIRPQ